MDIAADIRWQRSHFQLAYCGMSYCRRAYSKTRFAELYGSADCNPRAVPAPVYPSVESEGVGLVEVRPVDRKVSAFGFNGVGEGVRRSAAADLVVSPIRATTP